MGDVDSALSNDYASIVTHCTCVPSTYFKFRDMENSIWNGSLRPILEGMEENIFLADEKHEIAEMHFKQMVENFRTGSEADYNYALNFDDGPLHKASKRIEGVNMNIRHYNHGKCIKGENRCPCIRLAKEWGLPEALPYIEIGNDYRGIEHAQREAKNKKQLVTESLLWL